MKPDDNVLADAEPRRLEAQVSVLEPWDMGLAGRSTSGSVDTPTWGFVVPRDDGMWSWQIEIGRVGSVVMMARGGARDEDEAKEAAEHFARVMLEWVQR